LGGDPAGVGRAAADHEHTTGDQQSLSPGEVLLEATAYGASETVVYLSSPGVLGLTCVLEEDFHGAGCGGDDAAGRVAVVMDVATRPLFVTVGRGSGEI